MTPALSINQPWAGLVALGLKDVENRTWWTPHRGTVLIHAGLAVDRAAWKALARGHHPVTGTALAVDLSIEALRIGGIVGATRVVDCVRHSESRWFVGPWGFVLADGHTLPFRPCRGAPGFFVPDFDSRYAERPEPSSQRRLL